LEISNRSFNLKGTFAADIFNFRILPRIRPAGFRGNKFAAHFVPGKHAPFQQQDLESGGRRHNSR
jgi:hypothetical protein